MGGVSYGKGVDLPEGSVRWISGFDTHTRIAGGGRPWLLDARDSAEHYAGTLPGATSLAQNMLMLQRNERVQMVLDAILADESREIILFANTAGVGGLLAGRDLWVMAFLHELGVPFGRMARLDGGFYGWCDASLPVEMPRRPDTLDVQSSLESLLVVTGLPHVQSQLSAAGETLQSCAALSAKPRAEVLEHLKELGLELADRAKLAGVLAKASREGAFGDIASSGS